MKSINLTGVKFTNLTVLNKSIIRKNNKITWDCVCDCGKKLNVTSGSLRSGQTKSCGCYKAKLVSERNYKHGITKSRAHNSWSAMKQRCYYKNHKDYDNYGAKGISVCDEWNNSFISFYKDMGEPPYGYSLDRIDFNLGYFKENCRWASSHTQTRNKSSNVNYTLDGVTMCKSDWARRLNISLSTLSERIKKWGFEKALTTKKYGNNKIIKNWKIIK